MDIITVNSILRVGLLAFIGFAAVRFRDPLALCVVILFASNVVLSRLLGAPDYIILPVSTLASGLLGWFIIRSLRERNTNKVNALLAKVKS